MSETARWYVLHTYSGYENTVASAITKHVNNRNLHHLINEVTIPMETVTELETVTEMEDVTEMTENGPRTVQRPRTYQRKKTYERKTFPGYVLVKMILTDETWHILRNIRGVTGFVGSGNDAIPLTDEEIAALGVERTENVSAGYQPGDRIKIKDGPFANFYGTVEEVDMDKERIRVVITAMFNRETPVELGLDQVEYVAEDEEQD